MVARLRTRSCKGELYTRIPKIEALLAELEGLPKAELVSRCEILSDKNSQYVPSECVLYFVRTGREGMTDAMFERLYKVLIGRVLRQLPKDVPEAKSERMFSAMIRDKARDTFCEWLTLDFLDYCRRLDFFEIRFASGVANLRRDAYRAVRRDQARHVAIESDKDDGNELLPEAEKIAETYNSFDPGGFFTENYRSELYEAIEALPDLQRRIVEMIMKDIPIYSENPSVLCISKALGKVDKTIRNQRDKAYATLLRKLGGIIDG